MVGMRGVLVGMVVRVMVLMGMVVMLVRVVGMRFVVRCMAVPSVGIVAGGGRWRGSMGRAGVGMNVDPQPRAGDPAAHLAFRTQVDMLRHL
jgi:hypothetical protein